MSTVPIATEEKAKASAIQAAGTAITKETETAKQTASGVLPTEVTGNLETTAEALKEEVVEEVIQKPDVSTYYRGLLKASDITRFNAYQYTDVSFELLEELKKCQ